ncbi:MAG: GGDEF domain-containing protein, partial [Oceanobacter sp.]
RYGGEEFAVILSACNAEEAFQRAETFRQHIEKAMIQIEDLKLSLTVSQGIFGATPCQTGTSEDWIKAADAALYDAKRSGRNRCQIAA